MSGHGGWAATNGRRLEAATAGLHQAALEEADEAAPVVPVKQGSGIYLGSGAVPGVSNNTAGGSTPGGPTAPQSPEVYEGVTDCTAVFAIAQNLGGKVLRQLAPCTRGGRQGTPR